MVTTYAEPGNYSSTRVLSSKLFEAFTGVLRVDERILLRMYIYVTLDT